eukprot:scaffold17.g493.t1
MLSSWWRRGKGAIRLTATAHRHHLGAVEVAARQLSIVEESRPVSSSTAATTAATEASDGDLCEQQQEKSQQTQQCGLLSQQLLAQGESGAAVPSLFHSVATLSRAGRDGNARKTNQDSCFAYEQFMAPGQALFAALDGHGPNGHLVSAFLKQRMPVALCEKLAQEEQEQQQEQQQPPQQQGQAAACQAAAQALTSCFLETDDALREAVNCQFSGSAAACSLLLGRQIVSAWVGDCRAVLVRIPAGGKPTAIPLTSDHKPTCTEERERILAAGGRVERLIDGQGRPLGPSRVWLASSWVPGLAMSRALGDAVAHSVGVSSQPSVTVAELEEDDRFLILATDGVWEFVSPDLAAQMVGCARTAEEAARTLVDAAWRAWTREDDGVVDDITVVAVRFA